MSELSVKSPDGGPHPERYLQPLSAAFALLFRHTGKRNLVEQVLLGIRCLLLIRLGYVLVA